MSSTHCLGSNPISTMLIACVVLAFSPNADSADSGALHDESKADEVQSEWHARIADTALEATHIRLVAEPHESLTTSKVGGTPYWPKERPTPTGADGLRLHFLAQINFSEVEDLPSGFPKSGLLQFFVAAGYEYGASFEPPRSGSNAQAGYSVVFHKTLSDVDGNGFEPLPPPEEDQFPVFGSAKMEFEALASVVTPQDYRFDRLVGDRDSISFDALWPLYRDDSDEPAHQLGGFASFAQEDPRPYERGAWILLFQLDTTYSDDFYVMWADDGIANFFIRPLDLLKQDFSRVWYHWDSG